jgi:proline racemase
MDNGGYLDMCGHGIISVVTALIETGMVDAVAPETIVTLDTPAGAIECIAQVRGDGVSSVSMRNVPAFVFAREVSLELPEIGQIHVDIAFGGNFFALVSAPAVGIQLVPSNTSKLSALGLTIREMVNEKVEVLHPTKPHITRVALTEFYETPDPARPFLHRNVTVFGRGQVDRSPCGTGTSAAMALLNEKGALPIGVEYVSESIIGTRFTGTLTSEGKAGTFRTVTPMIAGEAFITGLQQFIVDPDDPIPYGFALD